MYLKPLSRVPFEYETMKCYGKTIYHIYIWLYTRSSLLKTYIPRYVFKQFSMHYLMPLEVLIYLYKCAPGMYISFLILLFFFLNAFSSFSSPDWCDIGFYLYLLPPNYTDQKRYNEYVLNAKECIHSSRIQYICLYYRLMTYNNNNKTASLYIYIQR